MKEPTRESVLKALGSGARHGVTIGRLVEHFYGLRYFENRGRASAERCLRQAIEALRCDGHRICATPETGYFLAQTDAELDQTCGFLYARAMTSLRQVAAMKRVALPDLRGQLRLPLEPQIGAGRLEVTDVTAGNREFLGAVRQDLCAGRP